MMYSYPTKCSQVNRQVSDSISRACLQGLVSLRSWPSYPSQYSVVLYRNFRCLAFFGFLGFLVRQLKTECIATLLSAAKNTPPHSIAGPLQTSLLGFRAEGSRFRANRKL